MTLTERKTAAQEAQWDDEFDAAQAAAVAPAARTLPASAVLQYKLDAYEANGAIALQDGRNALVFSARGVEQLTPCELMARDDLGVAMHGTTCAGGWMATDAIQIEIRAAAKRDLPTLQAAIERNYYGPAAMRLEIAQLRRAERHLVGQAAAQRAANYIMCVLRQH